MLEKIKARFLGEETEGGQSRTDEQSSDSLPEPISPQEVQVLTYLSQHQDRLISYDSIARGSRVEKHRIGGIIRKLVDAGAVVRSVPNRHGTRYWINSESKSEGKLSETVTGGSEEDDIGFLDITNELIFSFIRETRRTDVLDYLTWLELKGAKNGTRP